MEVRKGDFSKKTFDGPEGYAEGRRPGFVYDPASDRLVMWEGGPVYALHPETRQWKTFNPPGAPSLDGPKGKITAGGTYGRFRYVPKYNAFVLVTGVSQDVSFYKMPSARHLQ